MFAKRQLVPMALCLVGGLAGGLAGGLSIAHTTGPDVDVLVSTTETVIGGPIIYPEGTAQITAAIVSLEPGQETGWHRHNVPLFAYVMEGEISIDYGEKGVHRFSAGDAFVEATGVEHNGMIAGSGAARVLAVFAGAEGTQNTTATPH